MNLANTQAPKTLLVTGGAKRIGAAIGALFHEKGYTLALHCHQSVEDAEAFAFQLNHIRPDSAKVFMHDLTQLSGMASLIERVVAWSGRLDVLVNNASVFYRTPPKTWTPEQGMALFQVNVLAPYALSMAALKPLALHQGAIINMTDIHAQRPLKDYSLYCQSKAALEMQTLSLAKEFAPDVRVNAVAPGAIAWPEGDNALGLAAKQHILEKTPLKRHGHPEDIARAVLYLAENTFVTGQVLNVDGGRSL